MNHPNERTKLKLLRERILSRKGLIGCGREFSAALHSGGRLVYVGSDRWGQEGARAFTDVTYLFCGRDQILTVTGDGMLRMSGRSPADAEPVSRLSCARAVSGGTQHVAALLGNGRAVAVGDNGHGQCNVSDWPSVVDVVCGRDFTAGLTTDGQVVITGGLRALRYTVRAWTDVAGIFADYDGRYLYGINAEGRLLSSIPLPPAVSAWTNLVFAAACGHKYWGVTATGQLLTNDPAGRRMNPAKYYVACAVSETHALALTRDGQVSAVGDNRFGQCATGRFGSLFEYFDEFVTDRAAERKLMEEEDRAYQIHLAEANRYQAHVACGERLTACITADGHVLTSAGFRAAKEWTQVRALACGSAHVVALLENGTVKADGNDVDGCMAVSDWHNVKAVAAGKYHSLAVTEDGLVLFCGRNDCGQGNVSHWSGVRHIYAADKYTVGVRYTGEILIAGTPPFDPAMIDETWQSPARVVVTPTHMVALYDDGCVLSTRSSQEGEATWQNIRTIAAGHGFTVGLSYGGRVLAAGENGCGQCGTEGWKHVVQIACGKAFTLGLTEDGHVLCVGGCDAEEWQVTERWTDVMALSCGTTHAVALTRAGTILACGEDDYKQCSATTHFTLFRDARQLYGHGQYSRQLELELHANRAANERREGDDGLPVVYETRAEAARVLRDTFAVGMAHTVMLEPDGRVRLSGANDCGQCDLVAYTAAVQVAAGHYRTAAVLDEGSVILSGRNTEGQGDARSLNQELTFGAVSAEEGRVGAANTDRPFGWIRVSCGYSHTAALRSDGRVFAIGSNREGQCDTHKWRDVVDLACGIRHTVALREDGSCVATGSNRYGQCNVSQWFSVAMVAAGEGHTVALRTDGRVMAVGDNRKGQCDVEDLTDVVFVACLPEGTLCVCEDGHVILRGGSGELNEAVEALCDVVALQTCEHRIAAMTADRSLILIP